MIAGYEHAASGNTVVHGPHIEPAARVTLRLFGIHQMILEGSGFFLPIPGVAQKDRLALSFPVLGRKPGPDLMFSVERTMLGGRDRDVKGDKVTLDPVPYDTAMISIGARL